MSADWVNRTMDLVEQIVEVEYQSGRTVGWVLRAGLRTHLETREEQHADTRKFFVSELDKAFAQIAQLKEQQS